MSFVKKYLVLAIAIFGFDLQASIFLEPYIGYYKADFETTTTSLSTEEDKSVSYGGRLGFTLGSFLFIAGDALLTKGEYKHATTSIMEDFEALAYSGVAGFKFGQMRLWYGHFLKVDMERENAGVAQELDGSGWKAGLGFIVFRKIGFNFEYVVFEMDKLDGIDLPTGGTQKIESKAMMATISFPIGF